MKAEENMLALHYRYLRPQIEKIDVGTGDSFILDFGEHCVGHFSFAFDVVDDFVTAPVKRWIA